MDDFENKIMPGVLHWNHPNFFAYFGAGNAYPSLLGDMLSSGIAAIGFSWVIIGFSSEGQTKKEKIISKLKICLKFKSVSFFMRIHSILIVYIIPYVSR